MKKIIWTPKVHDFKGKKLTRWCDIGEHIFINYKADPPTKICKYCRKEEHISYLGDDLVT